MAVGDSTYGTVAGVQVLVGWMVDGHAFSESTTPTTAQVEALLDDTAATIHMKMSAAGYTVDTKAVIEAAAPRAAQWLGHVNNVGAAAAVMSTSPFEADPDSSQRPAFDKRFKELLGMIGTDGLEGLGLSKSTDSSSHLDSGSYQTADGADKLPMFWRGMWDFPQSRPLTTEDED